jgi:mRNA interferase RelE/StbE
VTFSVVLSRPAIKTLDAVDRPSEQRIRTRILDLAGNPFDPRTSKPLAHPKGYRSSRVGGWRIIFVVSANESRVEIMTIESRGQVYRGL